MSDDRSADDAFAERARAVFDDSIESLDAETRSRLNRGRHAALEAAGDSRPLWRPLAWLPATAAAAAIAVVVLTANDPAMAPAIQPPAADMEILLNGDDLEMLDDLEFYSWIDLETETTAHVG